MGLKRPQLESSEKQEEIGGLLFSVCGEKQKTKQTRPSKTKHKRNRAEEIGTAWRETELES